MPDQPADAISHSSENSEAAVSTAATPVVAGHIPALDGVRGLAVLLVLAHNFDIAEMPTTLAGRAVDIVMNAGWIGVQLFFVLSGFLITGILLDTREAPNAYRAFFARRLLRIFPLSYAAFFVVFVIVPHVGLPNDLGSGGEHQIWFWTYLCNWVQPYGRVVPLLPHFWSLAVEEQFYLVWPFVVLGLGRRALLPVTLALAVLALALRLWLRVVTHDVEAVYMFTVCRADALALGAACAIALRTPAVVSWLAVRARLLMPAAVGALALLFIATKGLPRTTFLVESAGYTILALIFALLIAGAAVRHALGKRSVLAWRPLQTVGKYSYGMYVFHQPLHLLFGLPHLGRFARSAPPAAALAYFAGATAVTFGAAYLSYHGLEKHFLRLKRYFVPSVKAPAP